MNRFNVRKVAVLGAGVMGAQIAAHLVNVKVPVVLFDLPAKEGPKNGIVTKAIDNLKKLKPAPLGVADDAEQIRPANYDDDLALLEHLLHGHALVTLCGAGGIGKTRLARAAAARFGPTLEGRVWWVELAPLADPSHVASALLHALGAQPGPVRSVLVADAWKLMRPSRGGCACRCRLTGKSSLRFSPGVALTA